MLRDAALCTLDLAAVLATAGYRLQDGHPWNVTFNRGEPKFLDFSSIVPGPRIEEPWVREFFRTFYIPLWLRSKYQLGLAEMVAREGPPIAGRLGSGATGRYLFGPRALGRLALRYRSIARQIVRSERPAAGLNELSDHIRSLRLPGRRSAWGTYPQPGGSYEDPKSFSPKAAGVHSLLKKLPPGRLVDLGSNQGWLAGLAASMGHTVVGVDNDPNAIDAGRIAEWAQGEIDFAYMDLLWPTPRQGLFLTLPSCFERWQSDTILMVALAHHLLIRRQVGLAGLREIALAFGAKNVVIEWIPGEDDQVRGWASRGIQEPGLYREEAFVSSMAEVFPRHEKTWSGPAMGRDSERRSMYLFQRT